MCELFTMSSTLPTEASFSLDEFSRHGGLTDLHKDGWGIAYYDKNDARIIKEASSASDSPYLRFIKDHSIQSKLIISHIRLATKGEVSVRNTQPFSRELGGKLHVFAHNGDLDDFSKLNDAPFTRFKPIGNTDSEYAFCYLMQRMAMIWDQNQSPELAQRMAIVEAFANKIRKFGIANFIYSDSEYVYVHSHKRISSKDNTSVLPGLHIVCRSCPANKTGEVTKNADINGLTLKKSDSALAQKVILAASVPLSDESWQALEPGEIKVFQDGKIII